MALTICTRHGVLHRLAGELHRTADTVPYERDAVAHGRVGEAPTKVLHSSLVVHECQDCLIQVGRRVLVRHFHGVLVHVLKCARVVLNIPWRVILVEGYGNKLVVELVHNCGRQSQAYEGNERNAKGVVLDAGAVLRPQQIGVAPLMVQLVLALVPVLLRLVVVIHVPLHVLQHQQRRVVRRVPYVPRHRDPHPLQGTVFQHVLQERPPHARKQFRRMGHGCEEGLRQTVIPPRPHRAQRLPRQVRLLLEHLPILEEQAKRQRELRLRGQT
mmetsp:Transcript_14790/g.42082  ORF Transcript_14790/g.42082 Transcript_14790/m.42082 type:complete len:271 (-) Transcript_14790:842-1654(-)